jgi:hypothetical protein
MRAVWWDIVMFAFGVVLNGFLIARGMPSWLIGSVGVGTGMYWVWAIIDYRGIIRRRGGMLGADTGWKRGRR